MIGRRNISMWLVVLVCLAVSASPATASRTYTTDADFDEGVLVGVEHDTVPDQLQLSEEHVTLPFIWVPNLNGTVSKIDTETGDELGRYRVVPPDLPGKGSPSRTTVDLEGNCWVGNRAAGTVVKIGLYEAGNWVDRNGDSICQTSQDLNEDGDITGGEILDWGEDECVLYEVLLIAGKEGTYAPGTLPPGDPPIWQPTDGKIDGALLFNGSGDYVELPIGSLISSLTDCTFATWVNFSNTGGAWQRIFDFGSNTTSYMFLTPRLGGSGAMRFGITIWGGGAQEQLVTAPSTLPSGWHHVAVTIAEGDPYNTIRLYLDGEVVAENTSATLTPSDLGETTNNWLVRSQYPADAYFEGSLDDFRIYDYALTQPEIFYLVGGTILREVWEGIGGNAVSDLTSQADYPLKPSFRDELTSFEAPTNWGDNHGTRVHGYLHPDTSGDYTFWIASDDNSELWLSIDDNPGNAVLIANVPGWTSSRQWDKYPTYQQSDSIHLEAGQNYYIMALYKEGTGGDNLAVAWEGPDCPTRDVIDGYYLSPYTSTVTPEEPPIGPVAHWQLDESSGMTAYDSSGNAYHGTLIEGWAYDVDSWSTSPRGLAIDAENNLWAGTWASSDTGYCKYYHIDGATGAILKTVDTSTLGHNAYGAVIDGYGILWSSGQENDHVLRLDPSTDPPTISAISLGHFAYGLGLDYLDHLFVSSWQDYYLSRINISPLPVTNLLTNPGFEDGTIDPWLPRSGESLAVAVAPVHSGSYSASCTNRNHYWDGPKQSVLGIMQDGKTYRVSGWARLDNAPSDSVGVTIMQIDGSGPDPFYRRISWSTGYDDRWVHLSGLFTLNVTGTLNALDVYFEGPAAGVNFYVDDAAVEDLGDWTQYDYPDLWEARGVACTSDNDVWVACTGPGYVRRYDNDGILQATIAVGSPTGVAVDAAGKVWACNLNDDYIKRIDPATNTVDLEKLIIGSAGHYSYSDMTGIVARTITTKTGTWTVIYDAGEPVPWGTVSWTSYEPVGTSITAKARSSNDQATWSAWETAENGVLLTQTPCARYLQVETTLQIVSGDESPVLYDLTVTPSYMSVTYDGDTLISTGGAATATATLKATLRDELGDPADVDGKEVTFTLSAEGKDDIVVLAESVDGVAEVEAPPLEPDIYSIEVAVECASDSALLVVYNPEGGFATGGGWIVPEDDGQNTHPNERANFGFNAKYKQDSPTGHLEFRYSDGYIDLKSSSIEQLVITGGKIVQFKGWASVNREEGHWFFVKAIDNGEPGVNDTFDIKVWAPGVSEEGDPTERAGGVLQGGNIVVHTK